MIHRDIILLRGLFLLLLVLNFELGHLPLEHLLPLLTKSLHIDKLVIFDPRIEIEHRRVPVPKLKIYFARLPLEVGFVELGKVLWEQINEFFADILQLCVVIVTVELKRTVHDTAVVERGHSKGAKCSESAGLEGPVRFILNTSHY